MTTQILNERLCHASCVAWSNADLSGAPEDEQTAACGTFYANLCAFDAEGIRSLLDAPPATPPPPFPPDIDLERLSVVRVVGAGGFTNNGSKFGETTGTNPLADCTDNVDEQVYSGAQSPTPCMPVSLEQPYVMFDIGVMRAIYSARVYFLPPAPP